MKNNFFYLFFFCAFFATMLLCFTSCSDFFKNDYTDNSPTSGKLKVYFDDGLDAQVRNQAATFESQYSQVRVDLYPCSESDAVQALYSDSCQSIVISRLLSEDEKRSFASKDFFPRYSAVAKSGVALLTNVNSAVTKLSYNQVIELLTKPFTVKDSAGTNITLNVIFDKNNSSVTHYLKDSVLKGQSFSRNCNILGSCIESINFVALNKNTVAFVDYACISDVDDSLYKANKNKISFICISAKNDSVYEYPDQSSFKLNTYPFTRTIYVYRKTGDFTLAKGFESYVAGPKGQLTFLKQGLLPTRQAERKVEINTRPLSHE